MVVIQGSIFDWISPQVQHSLMQSTDLSILTALARTQITNTLGTSGEKTAPVGDMNKVRQDEKILFRLNNDVEHLLVLQTQARLLGLPMDTNTLIVRGPGGSLLVVVDRAKLGRNEKPSPITKSAPDAVLLSEQIVNLNLEFAA